VIKSNLPVSLTLQTTAMVRPSVWTHDFVARAAWISRETATDDPMRDGVLNVWKDEIVVSHFFKKVGMANSYSPFLIFLLIV